MASVDFRSISKRFPDGTHAVSDFSLHIGDGELVVLVGPSGCGKSTLLRMLAGLEEPTDGTLSIGGRIVNGWSPQQRNIAMVFQDYALYPHMSVRRNLEFPLKMRKLPRAEIHQQVDWVAELLDIGQLLDRKPRQLSGGQRQRVAMGRALVRHPAVFLMDEPLSNLDAKLRVQIRAEIGELQKRTGTTMLYVTHDQAEAMTLGQRVAVLHQGLLQQAASPQELYEKPGNTFVAGFIGNPPMNLFPATLFLGADQGLWLKLGDQSLRLNSARFQREQLRSELGKRLTGGVRPEGLRIGYTGTDGVSIKAACSTVEYLGHETLLYLRIGTGPESVGNLIARLPGTYAMTGQDDLTVLIDQDQLHLFSEDGEALPGSP